MATGKRVIDYSLYLVTGRELLPAGKDYAESLEESIRGGVTVVQIREKTADTGEFLRIASHTKEICQRYNVPVIVNDRIDIALAIEADGVHLGQSVSVNNPDEAKKAKEQGADYVGIGALWETRSKQLTSPVLGVRSVGRILDVLAGTNIKAVAIGGIKSTNALRALHGAIATTGDRRLDGLAVISDIVASNEPRMAALRLSSIIKAFKSLRSPYCFSFDYSSEQNPNASFMVHEAGSLLEVIKKHRPLVHQITNIVVSTQSANATLALGASPIMSNAPDEMQDLSQIIGGLLINIGTVTDKDGMLLAGRWANINRKPIVFDPVGVGASSYRKRVTKDLLGEWQATVIKGNAGEIGFFAESLEAQAKGVDSIGAFADPASVVKQIALKERCIVLLTGAVDWISDGQTVLKCTNGHSFLGDITGSGCMLGSTVAAFCGASSLSFTSNSPASTAHLVDGNMLIAALGGLLALTVASEIAGERPDVKGTGSFLPALIDSLYSLTSAHMISRAKVEIVQ